MKSVARFAFGIGVAAVVFWGCGTILPFSRPGFNPARDTVKTPSSFQVLYHFTGGKDGAWPVASLVALRGTLYGTTIQGGTDDFGTVFSVTKTGVEKVLHRFSVHDGASPEAGLINVNGTLYGTTQSGGKGCRKRGCGGTVFSITPAGVLKVIYDFKGGSDGAGPVAGLLDVKGTLYGTTGGGGDVTRCIPSGCGTVFSVTTNGAEKAIYRFEGRRDGAGPEAGLVSVGGTLYGTTVGGGAIARDSNCQSFGCGTVYSVTTSGQEKVLHRFKGGADGEGPQSGLVAVNGVLYGTTPSAGSGLYGTAYRISTTGIKRIIFRFERRAKGESPYAALISVNGTLYGTTGYGGSGCSDGCGTVFSLSTTGKETVLHSFAGGSGGALPSAGLIDVGGSLYGTTMSGGAGSCGGGCGTAFALSL